MKLSTYDEAGNLLDRNSRQHWCNQRGWHRQRPPPITTSTGGWTCTYDSNGCLTEKTNGTGVGDELWEYSWDPDDRLVQVSKGVYTSGAVLVNEFTVNYSYDSMGRMLRRDNGTDVTTFVWDGWDLLSETTNSVTTTYLVPDGLVWSFSRGEDVFQVHTDALGSVRVVTDSDGDVVARFEFVDWGELLPGSFDNVGLALRFIGALGVRTDLETGLMYMRHRWYDATLQRFISRDPIGLEGGSNPYWYANNNPAGLVDPEGLSPYSDQRLLNSSEAAALSDAFGLLSRLGGDYRKAALGLASIHSSDRLYISLEAQKLSFYEGQGYGDGLTEIPYIYLNPYYFENCDSKSSKALRFRRALHLAAVLYHEYIHYIHNEGRGANEQRAYTKQLEFVRDLYNFELHSGAPYLKDLQYAEGRSSRLGDMLDYGRNVQNDAARHLKGRKPFPGGVQFRWK